MLKDVKEIHTHDFETYYTTAYSLKAKEYSTSLYILDPQFETIGVGVRVDDGETKWMTPEEFVYYTNNVDWSQTGILAHHTHFDGLIDSWHYNVLPAFYFDTLSMARALHGTEVRGSLAKVAEFYGVGKKGTAAADHKGRRRRDFSASQYAAYGEYCKNDVNLTWDLFGLMVGKFPDSELELIDSTVRMFTMPTLELDIQYAKAYHEALTGRKQALLDATGFTRGEFMSNDKFAELLIQKGIEPGKKISGRTKKETWAFSKTDPFMQQLKEHDDDEVKALAEARLGIKSTGANTRASRFIRTATMSGGPLPVYLNYAGAHTLRFSGGDGTNYQNLNRTDEGFDPASYETKGALRWSIIAPAEHYVLVSDSAQIEARTLAWLAGHETLVDDFRNKIDVYSKFASTVYGRVINPKVNPGDKTARFVGKVCVLGLGYGMGAAKLGQTLLAGTMGPKVVFNKADIASLGVDVDSFIKGFKYGTYMGEDALNAIPAILTFEERLAHFAVSSHLVKEYRRVNPKIKEMWDIFSDVVIPAMANGESLDLGPIKTEKDAILLPSGMRLKYNELHWSDDSKSWHYKGKEPWPIKLYGGLLVENVVQALARIIITDQMLALKELGYHIATMTHDEIVCVEPKVTADERYKMMELVMRTPPDWADGLPLDSDGGFGERYGEVK